MSLSANYFRRPPLGISCNQRLEARKKATAWLSLFEILEDCLESAWFFLRKSICVRRGDSSR